MNRAISSWIHSFLDKYIPATGCIAHTAALVTSICLFFFVVVVVVLVCFGFSIVHQSLRMCALS